MTLRLKTFAVFMVLLSLTSIGNAQESSDGKRLTPREIDALGPIAPGPGTSGITGIKTRILTGDPNKPGLYTIQLTVPANTTIQAHDHPDDRIATVISGTWYIGYGNKFDEKSLKALSPGSFYTEPPNVMHSARTGDSPVVVMITGFGPTGTEYFESKEPKEAKGKGETK